MTESAKRIVLLLAITILTLQAGPQLSTVAAQGRTQGMVIDRSLVNVDGAVYTLQDFLRYADLNSLPSLEALRTDRAVATLYQSFIMSKILQREGEKLGVSVRSQDFDRYLEEVALQNQLSVDEFVRRLEESGQNMTSYRAQVEADILRARIFGHLMSSSVTVTDDEVAEYLSGRDRIRESREPVVLLRQIVVRNDDNVAWRKSEVDTAIAANPSNFGEIARNYSDGTDAPMGGIMGLFVEQDLADDITKEITSLNDGEVSDWVERRDAQHRYQLEARFRPRSERDEQLVRSVRAIIGARKRLDRAQEFFGPELAERYVIQELF